MFALLTLSLLGWRYDTGHESGDSTLDRSVDLANDIAWA